MSKLFRGKSPFDDPFFTQPFDTFFGANPFDHQFFAHPIEDRARRQVTIEELDPEDDDGVKKSGSGKEFIHEKPIRSTKGMERSFMYRRVAYGGTEGMYYSCSEGMMAGGDGVFLAEMKEEDKTIGESLHTISKGLRNKGHSMTTKNLSNGERNSMQTLHNLNEDDLSGFEEDWKSNAEKYFSAWNTGFSLLENSGVNQHIRDGFPQIGWDGFPSLSGGWCGWALPSSTDYGDAGTSVPADGDRPRKVVPVNID